MTAGFAFFCLVIDLVILGVVALTVTLEGLMALEVWEEREIT